MQVLSINSIKDIIFIILSISSIISTILFIISNNTLKSVLFFMNTIIFVSMIIAINMKAYIISIILMIIYLSISSGIIIISNAITKHNNKSNKAKNIIPILLISIFALLFFIPIYNESISQNISKTPLTQDIVFMSIFLCIISIESIVLLVGMSYFLKQK